jgi:protein-disulfide isomerase
VSTTAIPDRFATLPDQDTLQATVVALVDSGLASGQVLGTPTLFIDGAVHRGGYDPPTLLAALAP